MTIMVQITSEAISDMLTPSHQHRGVQFAPITLFSASLDLRGGPLSGSESLDLWGLSVDVMRRFVDGSKAALQVR